MDYSIENPNDIVLEDTGKTVRQTNAEAMETTRNLYRTAFSKGMALHYSDDRCPEPALFVRANPDGSEDLVRFDIKTSTYTFVKHLVPAGKGFWADCVPSV